MNKYKVINKIRILNSKKSNKFYYKKVKNQKNKSKNKVSY